jgi:hypothetical protein
LYFRLWTCEIWVIFDIQKDTNSNFNVQMIEKL